MKQQSSKEPGLEDRLRVLHKIYSISAEALDPQRIQWCLEQIPKVLPPYPKTRSGRGILICAGGRQRLLQSYALISFLRKELSCSLPVDLVYVTEAEMQAPCIELFERELDIRCIDARDLINQYPYTEPKYLRGYMIKPFALLTSSFEEVILIDSDNIPLRDPTFLFDMQGYREHGLVLWRDFAGLRDPSGKEKIFEILGPEITPVPKYSHESGQMVINTRKMWPSLHTNWFLNNNHEVFYKAGFHGDADLYQIGVQKAGQSFFEMPYAPTTIGSHTTFADGIHGHSLGQRDLDGELLFAHRCCDDSYGITVGELYGSDEFTTKSNQISLPISWDWITAEAERPGIKVDANNKWILLPQSEPLPAPENLKRCYEHVCAVIEHLDAHELHRFP